jgi:hypothetical protein
MKVYAFSGLSNGGNTHLLAIYPTRKAGIKKVTSNPNFMRFYNLSGGGPVAGRISINELSDAMFEVVHTSNSTSESRIIAHLICAEHDLDIEDPRLDDAVVAAIVASLRAPEF